MQRIPRHCLIGFSRWIGACLLEHDDGHWYECYWLKLPSYQHKHQVYIDAEVMCQLVLFWHGKDGLRCLWIPVRDKGDV